MPLFRTASDHGPGGRSLISVISDGVVSVHVWKVRVLQFAKVFIGEPARIAILVSPPLQLPRRNRPPGRANPGLHPPQS